LVAGFQTLKGFHMTAQGRAAHPGFSWTTP
jgi:hypothetical protein